MAFDINADPNYTAYLTKIGSLNAELANGLKELLIQYLCYQASQGATLSSSSVATILNTLLASDDAGNRLF